VVFSLQLIRDLRCSKAGMAVQVNRTTQQAGRNGDEHLFCALIKRPPKASASRSRSRSRNNIMFSVGFRVPINKTDNE